MMGSKISKVMERPEDESERVQDIGETIHSSKEDRSDKGNMRAAEKATLEDILGNFSEQTGAIFD
jgi:hypothetical protein